MIECYYSACPNHSVHPIRQNPDEYEGPYCSQNQCTAGEIEQIQFAAAKQAEFRHQPLTRINDAFWYQHGDRLFLAGKINNSEGAVSVTVGFHEGNAHAEYVTHVSRHDVTADMYLRQMMLILHSTDIASL